MADTQTLQVQTHAQGAVPEDAIDLAVMRVRAVLRLAAEPVLFARVKLTMAADPAVERPAIAQANIDLNGRPVRAQAAAATMRDAIEMLSDKLQDPAGAGRAELGQAARQPASHRARRMAARQRARPSGCPTSRARSTSAAWSGTSHTAWPG